MSLVPTRRAAADDEIVVDVTVLAVGAPRPSQPTSLFPKRIEDASQKKWENKRWRQRQSASESKSNPHFSVVEHAQLRSLPSSNSIPLQPK